MQRANAITEVFDEVLNRLKHVEHARLIETVATANLEQRLNEFEVWCEQKRSVFLTALDTLDRIGEADSEDVQRLLNTVRQLQTVLTVPAVEYVPAMGDALKLINQTLKREEHAG